MTKELISTDEEIKRINALAEKEFKSLSDYITCIDKGGITHFVIYADNIKEFIKIILEDLNPLGSLDEDLSHLTIREIREIINKRAGPKLITK